MKASYTTYLYSFRIGSAWVCYLIFTWSIQYLFQNIFVLPVHLHAKCIIQRFVAVKQRFNPPISNMYPDVQHVQHSNILQ